MGFVGQAHPRAVVRFIPTAVGAGKAVGKCCFLPKNRKSSKTVTFVSYGSLFPKAQFLGRLPRA